VVKNVQIKGGKKHQKRERGRESYLKKKKKKEGGEGTMMGPTLPKEKGKSMRKEE